MKKYNTAFYNTSYNTGHGEQFGGYLYRKVFSIYWLLYEYIFVYTDMFIQGQMFLFPYLIIPWRSVHIDMALPYSFE